MSFYINSIIAKKSKVSYAIKSGLLYRKIFRPVWNHRISRYPPKKFSSNKSTKEAFHRKDYKAKEDNT